MAKVKTATLNGRKYKIDVAGRLDGLCDTFGMNDRHITIMAEKDTMNELVTTIHESLHACNWRATEKNVDITSKDIGRLLWRLGYRK